MQKQPGQEGQKLTILTLPLYIWIGAGLAIGAGIGATQANTALGLGIGLVIGGALAFTFYLLRKNKSQE